MTTYLLKNENDFLDLKENCFEYKHLTPADYNTLDAPLEYPCVVVICSFGREDFFDVEFVYPSIFNE